MTPSHSRSKDGRLSDVKEILAIVVPILFAVAWSYITLESRISKLEGEVGLLRELVVSRVATQTVTTTTTVTAGTATLTISYLAAVPLAGLMVVLLVLAILAIRRREGVPATP